MDDILRDFLTETSESIEQVDRELVRFERDPDNHAVLANIFRLVHTIKGTCGFLGLNRLEAVSHAAETLMSRLRDGTPVTSEAVDVILASMDRIKVIIRGLEETAAEPEGDDRDLIDAIGRRVEHAEMMTGVMAQALAAPPLRADPAEPAPPAPRREPDPPSPPPAAREPEPAASPPARPALVPPPRSAAQALQRTPMIRVGLDTLESLMTMVSELVLTRNQLVDIARRTDNADIKGPVQRLSNVTAELQERVMKTRMQPISSAWQKLPRLVRDLSAELGKDIELELTGADTEIDRQVLELIKDPFTHLVRNAADHGLETSQERRRAGKPGRGTIRISAAQEGGTITIVVADDGRGLDVGRIAAKALERGLATPAEIERMDEERIARFIFEPGFSTVSAVSHVSGRGVGMDVVRSNVELIGGSVDVRWTVSEGSEFTLKIPLTLAIVSALIIEAGGQRFALPQSVVMELVQPGASSESSLKSMRGSWLLRLRETLIPVVRLATLLGIEEAATAPSPEGGFIVVMRVGKRTVGLAVDGVFHTEEIVVKPMSGLLRSLAAFSGNTILGDGAVILILDPNGIMARVGEDQRPMRGEPDEQALSREPVQEEHSAFLVFRAGHGEVKAVPLAAVTRLEEFDMATIETVGGRSVAQYRGQIIPILPAHPGMVLRSEGIQPVLLFTDGRRAVGIAIDEVVDIVEERMEILPLGQAPGIVGTAVIRGRATEIVDVAHYLPTAEGGGEAPSRLAGGGRRRILLVDGAPFFRGMLMPVLKAAGYEVAPLADIDGALGLLARGEHFDAIVVDVEAPGRNGFDLAEELRAGGRHAGVPIIALASQLQSSAVDRARRLGLADFVAKFDRAGLLEALSESIDALEDAA
ncbi:MAG: hybrid sensor histidine kinase/response regulator [Burkholderiales bacterium]|nr:hybrid sensor histidine kinase/response regulator [Burkholderiales bacterium]